MVESAFDKLERFAYEGSYGMVEAPLTGEWVDAEQAKRVIEALEKENKELRDRLTREGYVL